jgi:hypothetical protein
MDERDDGLEEVASLHDALDEFLAIGIAGSSAFSIEK